MTTRPDIEAWRAFLARFSFLRPFPITFQVHADADGDLWLTTIRQVPPRDLAPGLPEMRYRAEYRVLAWRVYRGDAWVFAAPDEATARTCADALNAQKITVPMPTPIPSTLHARAGSPRAYYFVRDAVRAALEHEADEGLHFDGERIFDPHASGKIPRVP